MNRNSPSEPRLQSRFREATRTAILDAAESAFARVGLQSARMDAIAAAAGVAVGTLYNYFADRDTLLASVMETRRAELAGSLDAALSTSEDKPFAERLEALVAASFAHFDRHRELFAVLLQADSMMGVRPGALQVIAERVERLVRSGVKSGALRREEESLHVAVILGALRGMKLRALHAGHPRALAPQAARLTGLLLGGLAA